MKKPFRIVVIYLSISTFFSTSDVGRAGPFEDFFKTLSRPFSHPTPKPRPPRQQQRNSRKQSNETPPSDVTAVSNSSYSSTSPTPTPTPAAPPDRSNVRVAKATAINKNRKGDLPYGIPVPGKQGLVTSPFSPDSGYIDVRSFPPGTEVRDPYTGKSFLTP
ncbi:MAG TPA: hypothetical protein VGM62_02335 [Chthoniobacterales bacterium]